MTPPGDEVVVVAGAVVAIVGVVGATAAVVVGKTGAVVGVMPTPGTTGAVVGSGCVVAAGRVVPTPDTVGSSLVSDTKARISAITAATDREATSATGSRQFGSGASRVRAGAPQLRHQSCSGPSVAPQRGHGIVRGGCDAGGVLTARRGRGRAPGLRP